MFIFYITELETATATKVTCPRGVDTSRDNIMHLGNTYTRRLINDRKNNIEDVI